jgi:methylphosphotriester-DNA--protein-cysteine methyltransferase
MTPGEIWKRCLLGGHRLTKIYGRLDCPSALRAIARGGYVRHRVFFADEAAAIGAGYRPCARCMTERYKEWKANASTTAASPR